MSNKLYILLPVHNRKEITERFIECLKTQTFGHYHLVVIDDGSTDGTADAIRRQIASATVLRGNGNLWWAGSLQRGIQWLKDNNVADNSIVLFINDDVTFSPDYLSIAVDRMRRRCGVLMSSRFKRRIDAAAEETGVIADLRRLTFRTAAVGEQINCLPTRGLFVWWKDIKTIGGFHPRILPHYLSDYEYTIRARRKGLRCETSEDVVLCPNSEATGFHVIGESNFIPFLRRYFSVKSTGNPVFWSTFVILTSPKLWILPNLLRIWLRAGKTICKRMLAGS